MKTVTAIKRNDLFALIDNSTNQLLTDYMPRIQLHRIIVRKYNSEWDKLHNKLNLLEM